LGFSKKEEVNIADLKKRLILKLLEELDDPA